MRYWHCGVVAFGLPLFVCTAAFADSEATMMVDLKFDKTNDGIIDGRDWHEMKDTEKVTYARMSLEAVGENPDAVVADGVTRTSLLLQGLDGVYGE
ncbi:MAG: hypothetical protein R8M45_06685 [Ghiorsea sp.]